ncbi:MAG: SurA N-terminal domain-containing protein [Pelistega sp.]|nr:SurA N-terminal domain-containing protein [Pelistega sp.]
MLEFFRRHSKIMMILMFVVTVPSFVFFGVADYQSFTTNEVRLANINEQKITQADFNQSWTQRLNELRNSQGAEFDLSKADTPEARQAWLESLINNAVMQEVATKDKFSASDAMVRYALAQTPQFLDNGQFSMEAYNRYLSSIGFNSQQYETTVRAYEGLRLVTAPVIESIAVPASTVAQLGAAMTEERKVRLNVFQNADYAKEVSVSDDDLTKWYAANDKSFEIPTYVNVDYVLLNQDAVMAQVKAPADSELETYYQSNIARFSTAERRHVRHIQVADLATAEQVAAKAEQDPSQFEALAKEYSQDAGTKNTGGDLGVLARGDIPDLDEGVFALAQAGITKPVKIANNYHVFQIVSIQEGSVKPFAEVKEEISKEVRLQLASERFATLATDLTRIVHEQRDSLQGVADQLGLQVQTVNGITSSGLLPQAQVGAPAAAGSAVESMFTLPRVREAAFSAEVFAQGMNSGVIEISPSELLALRVKDKVTVHIPKLEDVKAQVTERVIDAKAKELAAKAGEAALAQSQLDNSTAGFQEEIAVSRMASNLPEALLNKVMSAPVDKLPFYVGVELDTGYAIARIESVNKENTELKTMFDQFQAPALNTILANELNKAFTANLRQKVKVEMLPAAQQVIQGETQP